jgi:hypothetical protein
MESEKHYKGKNFTMDWDGENKILSSNVSGYHRKEDAEEFVGKFKEFVKDLPATPLKILVNGFALSKSDHEARRIYTDYTKSYYKYRPGIVALCSGNLFIRMVGKFVVAVAPNTKFRIFNKVEDGLKWLKSLPN